MTKKVSYRIFILIVLLFSSSIFQTFFLISAKSNNAKTAHSISKTHLLGVIQSIECINEIEDNDEDKLKTTFQCLFFSDLTIFNFKSNNPYLGLPRYFNANNSLFGNVSVQIAFGIFRI